jgi:AraC family transcriptional regulator
MTPRIETTAPKKLIGKRRRMSFSRNETFELWRSFMPQRKTISNVIGDELYSLEIYEEGFFDSFNPDKEFEKWAAVEVSDYETIPEEMETLTVPQGLYAVFLHKGAASEAERTYHFIFREWLPHSNYKLDHRPHFAVMGEKYKKDSAESEEEIWIPLQPR